MNLKNKIFLSPLIIFLVVTFFLFSIFLYGTYKKNRAPGYSIFKVEDNDRYQLISKGSPYTVIVFFDLNCEYCKDLHGHIKNNKDNLKNTNLVVRNYPLLENGKSAFKALVGECVAAQEGEEVWFNYIDQSYLNFSKNQDRDVSYNLGKSLVNNLEKFEECTQDASLMEKIARERSVNLVKGITYTPSLVVLKNNQVVKVYNGIGARAALEIIKYYNSI